MHEGKLVSIRIFRDRGECEAYKALLESEKIQVHTWVKADDCGGMEPQMSMGLGGAQLMVREEDKERALSVLVNLEQSAPIALKSGDPELQKMRQKIIERNTRLVPRMRAVAIFTLAASVTAIFFATNEDWKVAGYLLAGISLVLWVSLLSVALQEKDFNKKYPN